MPPGVLVNGGDDIRQIGRPVGAALEAVQKARGIVAQLKASGNYLRNIAQSLGIEQLPVGVKTQIGNVVYTMAISAMRLKTSHAEVDIYLEIDLPGEEEDPVFGAFGIPFSRKGGFAGDIKLALLGDYPIDLQSGKSRIVLQTSTYQGHGTYAVVGCDGFKELNVEGYLVFSRDWLIPLEDMATPDETVDTSSVEHDNRVTAEFAFNAQSWDFVVSLQHFKPFMVAGVTDVKWEVGSISLDFSDFENPDRLEFPEDYHSPFLSGGIASSLWKGVYIEAVRVKLPDRFSKPGAAAIVVDAARIIIDNQGFTGQVSVYNILPLSDGNADGWAFSIDTFRLDIMAMQLREGSMAGLLHVPLLGQNGSGASTTIGAADCVGYQGIIGPDGTYHFTARPGSDYHAEIWKAQVVIASNSTIGLHYEAGILSATATLYGAITIEDDFSGTLGVRVSDIAFSHLTLSSRAPYFQPGLWDFPSVVGASMGGFSLNFSEIRLEEGASSQEANLRFIAAIELSGDNTAISASGGFRIEGQLENQSNHARWRFKKLKVEHIAVSASTSSWGLAGELNFYEQHSVFGNGFRGGVKVWFAGASSAEAREDPVGRGIAAIGQFGSIGQPGDNSYRYFFVDVMATFGEGIDIGSLKLLGIGGGVFNRMAPANSVTNLAAPPALASTLGSTLSGIVYQPDPTRGFRIKATLIVASPGADDAFSVNGTLEVVTNSSGGLDTIRVYGNVTMFGPVNWDNAYQENLAGVSIFIEMLYDNVGEERGFTAAADVFVNVAQGKVRGGAQHPGGLPNYAGSIDLKFSNLTWYVNIGVPDAPIAVDASLGPLTANLSAYLDIGNGIPPMPDLPDYVASLAGIQSSFMRNESLTGTGAGFAFGVSAHIAPGKKQIFPAFYYELAFGFGFDLMLQNYGNVQCTNNQSGRIGINGWYASGQAWAFLQGSFGIRVNLSFVQGEFETMQAALAAVLQAKGPNPFWAGARIAGNYRILGGLVKGSFRMKVEFGQECIMVGEGGDPLANLNLIMRTQPDENASQLPLNTKPSVLTNLPFDEAFEMEQQQYKLVLLHSSLKHNGQYIGVSIAKETGDNFLELTPHEFLPGNATIEFKTKVALMKKNGYFFTDTVKIEEQVVRFFTEPGLDSIPASNIAFSYPIEGQQNFFPQESNQGYLQLRQGQAVLLGGNLKARFTSSGETPIVIPAQYFAQNKKIAFEIPVLENDKVYRLEIYTPSLTPSDSGQQEGGGTGGPRFSETENWINEDKVLYTLYFRSSQYATFSSKINAIPEVLLSRQGRGVFTPEEPFASIELEGTPMYDALINFEVRIEENSWYETGNYQELIYSAFPMETPVPIGNSWRDDIWGTPPVKAIQWDVASQLPVINATHFIGGWSPGSIYPDTLNLLIHQIVNQDFVGYKNLIDSLIEVWVAEELLYLEELDPQQLTAYDYNGDGTVNSEDLRNGILNYCNDWNCNPQPGVFHCPQFSGIIPCPLPPELVLLHESSGNPLGSARGKSFEIALSYTLPGKTQSNSTAILRVKISQ
ncbi:MAG: hypothetical protein HUU01_01385 [Saprospiraceae bacterium]|nr:hypothetical protein [Saprospiraceae bacterium]